MSIDTYHEVYHDEDGWYFRGLFEWKSEYYETQEEAASACEMYWEKLGDE